MERDQVFHVGTLDPSKRGEKWGTNREGRGLSVSSEPEAWRAIAKLGDAPAHELWRRGSRWLDVWTWIDDVGGDIDAEEWCLASGHMRRTRAWAINDASGTRLGVSTRKEVAIELTPEGGSTVLVDAIAVSAKGADALGYERSGAVVHHSHIVSLYVSELLPWIDGCWWDAEVNIEAQTAPRGLIFEHQLRRWRVAPR